jgi:hypothetical protein
MSSREVTLNRVVVQSACEPAVDLGAGIDEAAALAEVDEFFKDSGFGHDSRQGDKEKGR